MCNPDKSNTEKGAGDKAADSGCRGPEMMAQMMEKCREAMSQCCGNLMQELMKGGCCPPAKELSITHKYSGANLDKRSAPHPP